MFLRPISRSVYDIIVNGIQLSQTYNKLIRDFCTAQNYASN